MTRPRSHTKTGDLIERAAEASLLADGWLVHRTRRAKFDTNDIFGVFDMIAVMPGNGAVLFVQTTTRTNENRRKRKVETWVRPIYDPVGWATGPVIQVWAHGEWPDGVGFRVWSYLGGRDWHRHDAVRPASL